MNGDNRIRVLLIHEAMGGVARNVIDLALGLDASRFDITLMHGTSRMDEYFRSRYDELDHRVRLVACDELVREISPVHDLRALHAIAAVIGEERPDVVHCHSTKAGALGRIAARAYGVPGIFYTPHAYAFQSPKVRPWKRSVYAMVERLLSRHATTRTFNVSYGERDQALDRRLDRPDKFHVIVNGMRSVALPTRSAARAALGLPQDVPLVGVVSRMVDQKDPMTAARILCRLMARRPRLHAAFVGSGPLEESVRRFCLDRGYAGRIRFAGERDDADRIVAAFDVSLLTSLYEGMPYSLIESLRAGVPVVATDVVGNDEVVVDGVNGALFPAGDVDRGAEVLSAMLDRPCDGDAVRESFARRFRLDCMISRIDEHYRSVEGGVLPDTACDCDERGR
ncbi:glycosyltransferase [Bifidobacterium simiarum]|uniref:glycosyltransferase n=1 Tax=Bifidobacterium simiarum TaxID=2045441 RepID=UPI001BDC223B|nr:glycosyltransferase [Bifidobacterium simiarum]MBT1165728.1 glycosyltransferase [Bifidobacterium simiarum]